jgi:hypothetical protein
VVVGLLGFALTYGGLGLVAGAITTATGMIGKNRNTRAAIFFSVVGAIGGLVLLYFGSDWVAGWFFSEEEMKEGPGWIDWVVLGAEVLGVVLAVIAAGWAAHDMVHSNKFCEECEEFMDDKSLPDLALGGLKALTLALRQRDLEAACVFLDAVRGSEGKPSLFRCSGCGRGYIEVTAQFKVTWKKKDDNEELEASWLTASIPLDTEEMERFRPHFEKA